MIDAYSSDEEIVRFLSDVKDKASSDAAVAAELARALAQSGAEYAPKASFVADVASTGGPSSLSTLLCPLFLRCAGATVPKLGVPGRPAGGIDCLAQIPGYRTGLTDTELDEVLRTAGYAHFLADGRYAPLDARVFKLRQQHGFQEVPTLVAASLLSKKIAVGVRMAGLDIRVAPHGNFGRSRPEAESSCELYRDTAKLLGIEAFPVLTDGTIPYQPYIGRSEALLALARLFQGTDDAWLENHYELCRRLALAAVPDKARDSVRRATRNQVREAFESNITAQGGDVAGFLAVSERCSSAHCHELRAVADGVVTYDLDAIRSTLVAFQRLSPSTTDVFSDSVGLVLHAAPGAQVTRGALLATARVDVTLDAEDVLPRLLTSLLRP